MCRKIFILLLTLLMLLSFTGCGGKKAYISDISPEIKGYKPFGNIGNIAPVVSEKLILAAENDYLALLYDKETFVVTVFDKRSGKYYRTAPENQEAASNNSTLAALNLLYTDSQGVSGSLDSYTQSVALGQSEVKTHGDSVTFIYKIGDVSDGLEVTPSVIGDEHFNELLEKADSSQQKILKRRYSHVADHNAWTRRQLVNEAAIEQLVEIFKDLGYTVQDLARDNKENSVADFGTEKLAFTVPLMFTLDGDSVVADIDFSLVEYPKSNPLTKIDFLQYFGAVTAESEGYFLIPDGSGAIMPFESTYSGASGYRATVYGDDQALRLSPSDIKYQSALMPIYGADYYDGGFLAVIEDGEALGDILAYNSGATDEYGKVYSRVDFLKCESTTLGEQKSSDNYNYYNFQDKPYTGKYAVRYIFLENGASDYSSMAASYRNYLLTTGALKKKNNEESSPLILETVGGILSDKSFLGFSYRGITALTKYDDNVKIADKLLQGGVENIKLRLTAFCGDGLQLIRSNETKLIGELGGKSGFNTMLNDIDGKATVYPDFNYLTFSANSGLSVKNKYALKSLDSKAVKLETLNYATLEKNTQLNDNLYYLNKISSLEKLNVSITGFLNKYSLKNMSIADMASNVSSDFSSGEEYDRQSAVNTAGKIINELSDSYGLMLSAVNTSNAVYADYIVDAPLHSSQYDFAEGIPFYAMVYHGFVPYSGNSVNLSSDANAELLRCIEHGAHLKYTVAYRNISAIKSSDYTELYSISFDTAEDDIISGYKAVNELYNKTADEIIVKHKKLAPSVYYTEYSNGVYTVVNYSSSAFDSEYGAVAAKDYIIG